MKTIQLLVASIALYGGGLFAATLSTISLPDDGYDVITYNSWKGQSFTLGTSADIGKLTKAQFQLEIVVANISLVARIVGSTPGTGTPDMSDVYTQLTPTNPNPGSNLQPVLFEEDQTIASKALAAGATYWLVIGMTAVDNEQSSPAGIVRWHYAATNGQGSGAPAGWNVGAKTAVSGTGGAAWSASTTTPYLFDVTLVPEPGLAALLLPAALLTLRRRRS